MTEERSGVALGNRWLVERRLGGAPPDEREHEIQPGDEVVAVDAPAIDRFGDAVLAHHQRLARFAYVLSGSSEIAEASVTEAYARLWPKFRRGRIRDALSALMAEIIIEVQDRTRGTGVGTDSGAPVDLATPWAALQHLSFEQRSALVLHLVEGVSLEETAHLLDETVATVELRVDAGLGRVAQLLVTEGRDG